jgi:hypothetical protein
MIEAIQIHISNALSNAKLHFYWFMFKFISPTVKGQLS